MATLHGALSKFYTQKNCRLNTRFATELLRRQPALGWCLAPLVVQHVGEARDASGLFRLSLTATPILTPTLTLPHPYP